MLQSDNIDTSDLADQFAALEAAFLMWDLYLCTYV